MEEEFDEWKEKLMQHIQRLQDILGTDLEEEYQNFKKAVKDALFWLEVYLYDRLDEEKELEKEVW